jgi:hypothetical protein
MLKLEGEERDAVTPSDVYDMATLLVSEFAYLSLNSNGRKN